MEKSRYPISARRFIDNFFKKAPPSATLRDWPVQVYTLRVLAEYIRMPTSVFFPDYYFVFYLHSGNARQKIDATDHCLNGPALIWGTLGTSFAVLDIAPDAKGYFVLFEPKIMSNFFSRQELLNVFTIPPVQVVSDTDAVWYLSVLKLIADEMSRSVPNRKVMLGVLQALVVRILELAKSSKPLSVMEEVAVRYSRLLYEHYREGKSIAFYADLIGVSPGHLNRCTNAFFGKSAKVLMNETLVSLGQILLWETALGIAEIAFQLNFSDPAYFARLFRKVTGESPSEYRRKAVHDLS